MSKKLADLIVQSLNSNDKWSYNRTGGYCNDTGLVLCTGGSYDGRFSVWCGDENNREHVVFSMLDNWKVKRAFWNRRQREEDACVEDAVRKLEAKMKEIK